MFAFYLLLKNVFGFEEVEQERGTDPNGRSYPGHRGGSENSGHQTMAEQLALTAPSGRLRLLPSLLVLYDSLHNDARVYPLCTRIIIVFFVVTFCSGHFHRN